MTIDTIIHNISQISIDVIYLRSQPNTNTSGLLDTHLYTTAKQARDEAIHQQKMEDYYHNIDISIGAN